MSNPKAGSPIIDHPIPSPGSATQEETTEVRDNHGQCCWGLWGSGAGQCRWGLWGSGAVSDRAGEVPPDTVNMCACESVCASRGPQIDIILRLRGETESSILGVPTPRLSHIIPPYPAELLVKINVCGGGDQGVNISPLKPDR